MNLKEFLYLKKLENCISIKRVNLWKTLEDEFTMCTTTQIYY